MLAVQPKGANLVGATSDSALVEVWLNQYSSEATRRNYAREAHKFMAWVGKPLAYVTLSDLQAYSDTLAKSGGSVAAQRLALMAIKSLLAFGARTRYLPWDVGSALRAPKEKSAITARLLSTQEVLALLNAPKRHRDKVLLRFLYATGLRVSELCAATWENLRKDSNGGGILEVRGKGDKVRYVRISALLLDELQKLNPTGKGPLFLSQKRKPLSAPQVRHIVAKAAKTLGFGRRVSPHWLRHCAATHAIERNVPLKDLSAILGHSSIAVTSRYLHANPTTCLENYLPTT